MLIKLQQKTAKEISQFTTANSQQSTITSDSASHIITNAHIEIIIFDKNEKSSSPKRERSSKKHLFALFHKANDAISKKLERFSKNKTFVTVTPEPSIVKNSQFSQSERTIANQFFSTISSTPQSESQTIDKITSTIKSTDSSIKSNDDLKLDSAYVTSNINFKLINDLIYHCKNESSRLCILNNCVQNVLQIIHDDCAHADHYRTYVKLIDLIYIKRFFKQLITYLKHCFVCQLHQIKRHKFYKKLMSIFTTSLLYNIIIIDFVIELSTQFYDFDAMMFITNKCIKKNILISKKSTYTVKKWAKLLFDVLQKGDWNISNQIIFDKNKKFIFELWKAIFSRLRIKLMMIIAYHAQTNNQFKKTNQTIEIAFRFFITKNSNFEWSKMFFVLQLFFNNVINAIIDHVSNKIVFKFKSREMLTIIVIKKFTTIIDVKKKFANDKFIFRKKIVDVTFFVNAKIKIYYDVKHTPLLMKKKDYVFLKLNHDYRLSAHFNRKLFQQRCDLFLIKKKIERLAYELKLSLA